MNCFEFCLNANDFLHDVFGAFGPDEWFLDLVVGEYKQLDGCDQLVNTFEHAALEAILAEISEEPLHHIHPSSTGGGSGGFMYSPYDDGQFFFKTDVVGDFEGSAQMGLEAMVAPNARGRGRRLPWPNAERVLNGFRVDIYRRNGAILKRPCPKR